MTSLWDKFAILNVQGPPCTWNSATALRKVLRRASIPKGQDIKDSPKEPPKNNLDGNEDVTDQSQNSKYLEIEVVKRNKVIIKYYAPKGGENGKYKITRSSRKRKADNSNIVQRDTPCANCGYHVYATDFAISCATCKRSVHKGCWDALFDKLYMSERLKWTTSNRKREPARPRVCADCLDNKTMETNSPNGGNERKITFDVNPPKRRKFDSVIQYSLRKSSRSRATENTFSTPIFKPGGNPSCIDTDIRKKGRRKSRSANKNQESRQAAPTNHLFNEYVSWLTSKALDGLGHCINMIKHRQRMYTENDISCNRFETQPDERITTGGKVEGTTMYFESDTDYMFVVKNVVCAEDLSIFEGFKHMTFLEVDTTGCNPGYTRLKLKKLAGHYYRRVFNNSVVEMNDGENCLSNALFLQQINMQVQYYRSRDGFVTGLTSGPSTPLTHRYDSFDNVFALRCYCPNLIDRWIFRQRHNNWPTKDEIQTVAQLEAHVVPVGFKGSPNQAMEWRICYSLAELHLMKSLNECQIQMYLVLKLLSKECFQPICKDITSYVMKNVTLWVCENHSISDFQKNCLLDRTIDALIFLKKCIKVNNLPSYMIEQRNLLDGRIDEDQKERLTILLTDLIEEGACLFLRITKVRDALLAMYKIPSRLQEYAKKRDSLERLVLLRSWIREDVWIPGMSRREKFKKAGQHVAYLPLEREMEFILSFDESKLKEEGATMIEIDDLWVKTIQKMLC